MSLVEKELAGRATPEEIAKLASDLPAWRDALLAIYTEKCKRLTALQDPIAEDGRFTAGERRKTIAQKDAAMMKYRAIKAKIAANKPDSYGHQIELLTEIRDLLQVIAHKEAP